MTRTALVVLTGLAGPLLVGGCMTVPVEPAAGFPAVSELVRERTGHDAPRIGAGAEHTTGVPAIEELLADGLDAEEAVRIALFHNRGLQALYSDLGVAQSDLVQASLLHNPVADVSAGFPVAGGVADLSFGVAMDVVDLFYVPLRKRVARAELEATKLRVAAEVLDLAWRTQIAFYRHQANEQMIGMRRRIAGSTEAALELARRMRQAGNITELDLSTERALAAQARLDLRTAEIAASESREALNVLLGLWGEDAAWKLSLTRLPEPSAGRVELEGLEGRAVERSLDLAMAERRIVAAGEQLGLNRASALFPEILVGGEGQREGDWDAGPVLGLPLPFFDRGQARVARAREELRRARQLHRDVAVRVRSAVRAARDRAVGHRERALYYRDVMLPLRERIVRETQLRWNAMQLTPFDLLRAKEQQIEAGVRYVESLRDLWIARADLGLILAGRVPPADGAALPAGAIDSPRRSPIPTLN